jgi:sterol desaturase/sphingolipid hydroxylase (fatty acid hydroxylase superfamily)
MFNLLKIKKIALLRNHLFFFLILLLLVEASTEMRVYVGSNLKNLHLSAFVTNNLRSYIRFSFVVFPLIIFELLLPNEELSKDHRYGVLFWIISIQFNYFISLFSVELIHYCNISPIFNVSFKSLTANSIFNPIVLNASLIILSLLVFDFFYYWFHRMQHTFSFFWEFHKTHHSIKNLNSIVSYHHVFEEVFRIPFITLPLAILIHIDTPTLAILSSFFSVYGQFIHMNSKVSLGSFRLIFADNYYHRIHHSIEEPHYNKNYAAFFPVWDILFKTVHFPKLNEFPKVGLIDMDQPTTLKEYFFSPNPMKKTFWSKASDVKRK